MKHISIAIVIPTFNRITKLKTALDAIGRQKNDGEFSLSVVVSNSASTDGTYEFLEHFQSNKFSLYVSNHNDGGGPVTNWRRAVETIPADIDWVWFHGDDDEIIYERACLEIAELLAREDNSGVEFIHVTQARRSRSTATPLSGTVFEFCNILGFHEILGWMSSICMKKERFVNAMLPALASTVTLETASAYAHSTAIFAECWNSSGLLIDQPWIEPQDLQQTPESIKRWSDENMGERYFFLLDDWIRLSEKGFLPGGVSSIFFRYLNYSILDRLAVHVASEVLSGAPIDDRLIAHWSRLENVVNLLSDEEQRKRHRQWLKSLGVILTEFVASRSNFARLKASLEQHIILTANDHQFPFSVITGDLE